ncbi:MAG: hypothetical protein KC502_03640 [Myxococcales bacterium]|nr:hypothetical protein [Myxococcales bacterium]
MTEQTNNQMSGRIGLIAAVLVIVGAVGWFVARSDAPEKAPPPPAVTTWQSVYKTAGFKGERARKPDETSPKLTKSASALPLATQFSQWREAGKLRPASLRKARRHAVRDAAALFAELDAGKAGPAHAIEAAWLARVLCEAAASGATGRKTTTSGKDGKAEKPCAFVLDTAGYQTPLLLSHVEIGVIAADGSVVSPLGQEISQPQPLSDAHMVAWWLLIRAQVHRGQSQYKEAHADIALAGKLMPEGAAPQFARGVVQLDQGLLDRGFDTCDAALARQEDPFARLFLADVVAAMDKPFKAYQHVQTVLKTSPKLAEAHVSLALLDAGRAQTAPDKGKKKLIDKAKAGFELALKLSADVPGARSGLAQIALMNGDNKGAEKLLTDAVAKHGDTQAALVLAELLGMTERSAEAAKMLEDLGQDDDERFVQAIVKALAVSKQTDKALARAASGAKRFPQSAQLGLLHADLLRQAGKLKEAIAALEPHKTGADGVRMSGMQAQLFLQSGQAPKAVAVLAPLLKSHPTSKEIQLLAIVAYGMANDKAKQAATWTAAIKAGTLQWLDVAGVLIETGDANGAERALRAGLQASDPGVEKGQQIAVMLAMLLTASDRKAEAHALRDTLAAKVTDAGAKAALSKAIDEAIAGAEAEMATQEGDGASAAPPVPADK